MKQGARNQLIIFFFIAALITAVLFFLDIFLGPRYGGDIEWYIMAAEGRLHELIQPYSARFLHPFIVRLIDRGSALDIYQAFSIVAIASMFVFFVINIAITKNVIKKPIFLIPLFFLPIFFDTLRFIFHPDALYVVLTAAFFLALYHKKEWLSITLLPLLFLTRESTILLGAIFIIISLKRSRKFLAGAALLVTLASMIVTNAISSIGESNIHNLGGVAYLAGKFSYNFMLNVFGTRFWVSTYTTCEPIFRIGLPRIEQLGSIQEVGFCGFDALHPLGTIIVLTTTFGIAPLILFFTLFKKGRRLYRELPFWLIMVLAYGLVHYFIAIPAGTGVVRLVGYAWPAFLVAVPIFVKMFFALDKKIGVRIFIIHLSVAWLPFIVWRIVDKTIPTASAMILVLLGAYIYALRLLKSKWIEVE